MEKTLFFSTCWGSESIPLKEFVPKVSKAGYDGIENNFVSWDLDRINGFIDLLNTYHLKYIAQIAGISEADFKRYKSIYRKELEVLVELKPHFINSHTGADHYTFEQNAELINLASYYSKESGIPIHHEIHRGRFTYSPVVILGYIKEFPDISFVADFSHWCVVSESLLENHSTAVNEAIVRSRHIHSRIGHAQGPQIDDPLNPTWEKEMESHLSWWDSIMDLHRENNLTLGVTTEFGPPYYMPVYDKDEQVINRQWSQNVFMMDLLKRRWNLD